MASDSLDPRFDPAFQRGFEGDALAPVLRRANPDETPIVQPVTDAPLTLRGNPWVVVLWVLGPVFLAGGLWGLWQAEVILSAPITSSASSYYVLPSLLQAFSPWLSLVGLITIVAVVFLHAVRWRKRGS